MPTESLRALAAEMASTSFLSAQNACDECGRWAERLRALADRQDSAGAVELPPPYAWVGADERLEGFVCSGEQTRRACVPVWSRALIESTFAALLAERDALRKGIVLRDDDVVLPYALYEEMIAAEEKVAGKWMQRAEETARERDALRERCAELEADARRYRAIPVSGADLGTRADRMAARAAMQADGENGGGGA